MATSKKSAKGSKAAKTPRLSKAEPSAIKTPERPALFRSKELKWKAGTGLFKGVQVAVVSEDSNTGAKALFVKLPPSKKADARSEYHFHTAATHSLVLQGTVFSGVNGKEFALKAGDYARTPENWIHADSGCGPEGALIFMTVEGKPAGRGAARLDVVPVEQ
jgi:quercetin dioxygenase-like cupin family protein